MKNKLQKLFFLILFVPLLLSVNGCDSTLDVNGVAYEWINPPPGAQSIIYVLNADVTANADPRLGIEATLKFLTNKIASSITKEPLNDVTISLKYEGVGDKTLTSNSSGQFSRYWLVGGGYSDITFTASKNGYIDATGLSKSDRSHPPVVVILLVKKAQ